MTLIFASLLAAVSIAFPKERSVLPPVERCYVIGAVDGGVTNLQVCGRDVPVYRTGAWATTVPVVPGTNVIEVAGVRRSFIVKAAQPVDPTAPVPPPRVYAKLEYAADVAKPHPVGRKPSEITVVVDAGHGGSDSGAVSPHGHPEKDANLQLAKAVRQALENRGYKVVMTREDDSFPALYDRPKVAHRAQADAFVSIHYNAPGYDKDPRNVRYQAVYAWNPLGERLAGAINRRMAEATPDLPNQGVLHANFAVTRNPEIPSCLIETDFLTSPEGEEAMLDPDRRTKLAVAIADGFADWVASER